MRLGAAVAHRLGHGVWLAVVRQHPRRQCEQVRLILDGNVPELACAAGANLNDLAPVFFIAMATTLPSPFASKGRLAAALIVGRAWVQRQCCAKASSQCAQVALQRIVAAKTKPHAVAVLVPIAMQVALRDQAQCIIRQHPCLRGQMLVDCGFATDVFVKNGIQHLAVQTNMKGFTFFMVGDGSSNLLGGHVDQWCPRLFVAVQR